MILAGQEWMVRDLAGVLGVTWVPTWVYHIEIVFTNLRMDTETHCLIREIPVHATFRGKGVNTGLVRQTWGLPLFGHM